MDLSMWLKCHFEQAHFFVTWEAVVGRPGPVVGHFRKEALMKAYFRGIVVFVVLCLGLTVLGAGCENDNDNDVRGSSDSDSDSDGDGDGDADSDADTDADTDGTDCADAAKYVYVVDSNNDLYKFDPTHQSIQAFTLVGSMNCDSGGEPFAMSISRAGEAYVLFSTGGFGQSCVGINRVNINNAKCIEKTPFACGSGGFDLFAMGFVTNDENTTDEQLYLGSMSSPTLAVLDLNSWVVNKVGSLSAAQPDFTGNARGELWGFFPNTTPPKVAEIDKTSGAELSSFPLNGLPSLPGVGATAAWAFTYWGGSFYLFYMVEPQDSSTNVYKITDGQLELFIPDTGITVTGAGVSTCAPTVAVK
jgi:hypothetical protein